MFRNPRENVTAKPADAILPSTGRPPTPPEKGSTIRSSYFSPATSAMNSRTSPAVTRTPVIGRQPATKISSGKKNGLKPNQSILSFFGKTDKKAGVAVNSAEQELFFADGTETQAPHTDLELPAVSEHELDDAAEDDDFRHNEHSTPVKRRKIDVTDEDLLLSTPPYSGDPVEIFSARKLMQPDAKNKDKPAKQRGGFIDDSSDEDELEDLVTGALEEQKGEGESHEAMEDVALPEQTPPRDNEGLREIIVTETTKVPLKPPDEGTEQSNTSAPIVPTLTRESTSAFAPGEFGDDDFEDEFFEDGEEFVERRWMQEQREMEAGLDEDSKSEGGTDGIRTPSRGEVESNAATPTEEAVASCPMCNGSMKGLSESEASTHVNACLDGTAKPLPKPGPPLKMPKFETSSAIQLAGPVKRFQRAAIARPAQANPYETADGDGSGGSAFSRLMTGHAEDAAWAEAAANEVQSRGKAAYQRTCPFYKIMPGLYTCVDAFRYGKVEGQNAYFLSHFHSDHYIGLTSQWCHGPIYASKISCNLMRQQLRVDSKWLHPLEFEKRTEIPNTQGVFVTMIPANHCPGSSLYLFERVVGKNKDGSPRMNRILHCGDFRACPAHIKHPLLQPDVVDAITGQTKQQVIDTCYLDTTYLTPKFSFPSQSDVIDACAQMCVSLSKEIVDAEDSWEKIKRQRAGSVMTKFLEKGEEVVVKPEVEEDEPEDVKPKVRGRLLVVIGTYSIGKERICLGIARALKSKIYAPPAKMRICKALEDDELNALLTSDPLEARIHMQTLMEIRAETLMDYLVGFKGQFSRIVGFRPTGWTYRPPTSRFTENPAVQTVLHSEGWKSRFTMRDLVPQRGSTRESNCFGVPYSEHSSFRELTMFCCALRINRIIPTVNVGSARSREKMKSWIEKWDADKKKNGLFRVEVGAEGWGSGDGKLRYGV